MSKHPVHLDELRDYMSSQHPKIYEQQRVDYYRELMIYAFGLLFCFIFFRKAELDKLYSLKLFLMIGGWGVMLFLRDMLWRRIMHQSRILDTVINQTTEYFDQWEEEKVKELLPKKKSK